MAKKAHHMPGVATASDVLAAAAARHEARALVAEPAAPVVLSAADRENPDKLSGEALRAHAHRRGIARSEAERMDDDKLRMQLRYITQRQYADESA